TLAASSKAAYWTELSLLVVVRQAEPIPMLHVARKIPHFQNIRAHAVSRIIRGVMLGGEHHSHRKIRIRRTPDAFARLARIGDVCEHETAMLHHSKYLQLSQVIVPFGAVVPDALEAIRKRGTVAVEIGLNRPEFAQVIV